MKPKISIIVPVYKVEEYLPKCIDSILEQTFTDFELILVDDGSPDRCGEICDVYAKMDKRVVVIHIKNSGVSVARNIAIDKAKGEYIGFIDSDDWIEKDMYQQLYNMCIENDADIGIIGVREVDETLRSTYEYIPEKIKFSDIMRRSHIWNKLLKKDILINNNIRFIEGRYYEDVAFTPKVFVNAKKCVLVNQVGYNYLQREGSITHSRDYKIHDLLWAYSEIKQYLVKEKLYKQYEIDFEESLEYLKNLYAEILYTYPIKSIVHEWRRIKEGLSIFNNISKVDYCKFVLKYIKVHGMNNK